MVGKIKTRAVGRAGEPWAKAQKHYEHVPGVPRACHRREETGCPEISDCVGNRIEFGEARNEPWAQP
jgi:hypothetical protein